MNKANYISDGSVDRQKYPLSVESLDFIQQQILLAAEMAAAAGNKVIVRGCTEQGSGVTAGIVVVNNELLPFVAGTKQTKVRIVERVEHITADFITYNNAKRVRYVEFGANVGDVDTFLWADFKRLKSTQELDADKATHAEVEALRNLITPKGVIVMWSGQIQDIPAGWALCNGQNGTPDMRNRFALGAGGKYAIGDQPGGVEKVTLQESEMPVHKHRTDIIVAKSSGASVTYRMRTAYEDVGTFGIDSSTVGGGQPHENMPPYFVLAYIMKL